jgi:hypothetical protein
MIKIGVSPNCDEDVMIIDSCGRKIYIHQDEIKEFIVKLALYAVFNVDESENT